MTKRHLSMLARYFLVSSGLVGTLAVLLPDAARAETTPPPSASATVAPATANKLSTGVTESFLLNAAASTQPSGDTSIRPFHFHASDEALADLKRRISATKWPEQETVSDTSQGVNLATIQKLANYWATNYDWRRAEAQLNKYPQFVTNIDGVDIHFIHVKSE